MQRDDQISFGKLAARVFTGDSSKNARVAVIQKDIDALEQSSQQQLEGLK